jgi:hypothetical protein
MKKVRNLDYTAMNFDSHRSSSIAVDSVGL